MSAKPVPSPASNDFSYTAIKDSAPDPEKEDRSWRPIDFDEASELWCANKRWLEGSEDICRYVRQMWDRVYARQEERWYCGQVVAIDSVTGDVSVEMSQGPLPRQTLQLSDSTDNLLCWSTDKLTLDTSDDSGVAYMRSQPRKTRKRKRVLYATRRKVKKDVHNDQCEACDEGGELLCCDFCNLVWHLGCLGLAQAPEGDWACPECEKEKENNPTCEKERPAVMGAGAGAWALAHVHVG